MFQTLDIIISLAFIYLILSMMHKYLMSVVKRFMNIKNHVIAEEMNIFIGENTTRLLVPYLRKKYRSSNLLQEKYRVFGKKIKYIGLRYLNRDDVLEVVSELRRYLTQWGRSGESGDAQPVKEKTLPAPASTLSNDQLAVKVNQDLGLLDKEHSFEGGHMDIILEQLDILQNRSKALYENTKEKISEVYESQLRMFTFFAGFMLAIAINADFFEIYHTLSTNTSVRDELVLKASDYGDRLTEIMEELNVTVQDQQAIDAAAGDEQSVAEASSSSDESPSGRIENGSETEASKPPETISSMLRDARKDFNDLSREMGSAGMLLGWGQRDVELILRKEGGIRPMGVMNKVFGLMVSGLLVGFGAPFWHDFLQAFVGIRKEIQKENLKKRQTSA